MHPVTPATATATSGTALNAIDGMVDWAGGVAVQTLWVASGSLPQSVTLDLGASYYNTNPDLHQPLTGRAAGPGLPMGGQATPTYPCGLGG